MYDEEIKSIQAALSQGSMPECPPNLLHAIVSWNHEIPHGRLTTSYLVNLANRIALLFQQHDQNRQPVVTIVAPTTDDSKLRPEVLVFAKAMEEKLRKKDNKGGWSNALFHDLKLRILDEYLELERSFDAQGIRDESVDIAAFAMMIFDNHSPKVFV